MKPEDTGAEVRNFWISLSLSWLRMSLTLGPYAGKKENTNQLHLGSSMKRFHNEAKSENGPLRKPRFQCIEAKASPEVCWATEIEYVPCALFTIFRFLVVTFKKEKKKAGDIHFHHISYSTQHIISMCNQSIKVINEVGTKKFVFLGGYKTFKIQGIFSIFNTCQFRLATFQMLNSHLWPGDTSSRTRSCRSGNGDSQERSRAFSFFSSILSLSLLRGPQMAISCQGHSLPTLPRKGVFPGKDRAC